MATAKKAATTVNNVKYLWAVRAAYSVNTVFDDSFWCAGEYASLEEALASDDFSEFMSENDHPDLVYVLAFSLDGKPHMFKRIEVKNAGFSWTDA